jgi:ArsR family transcriptional regulator
MHELFKALASENRIRIVRALRERALCVGALAARLEMTESAISQHLQVLRRAGLVEADKRGNFVHYSLAEDAGEKCRTAIGQVLGQRTQSDGGS